MSIVFETYNGENSNIDYVNLEKSIKHAFPKAENIKIFLLNKFPIQISSETGIDVLLIITIDKSKENNFHFIKTLDNNVKSYLHNLIIPITFVNHFKNEFLIKNNDNNELVCLDEIIDYDSEIKLTKYNLKEYLVEKLSYDSEGLEIHPIIFIRNRNKLYSDNIICNKTFSFNDLSEYLKKCNYTYFCSYKKWNDKIEYNILEESIKKIVEKAGENSKYGFLTKKKLDELIKKNTLKINSFSEKIGENLVLIKGKAGSGKTSALIKLMKENLLTNKRCTYLTYNKLLTYEVSNLINSFRYSNKEFNFELPTVITLSQFFYRLCQSFGVILIINEERINELTKKFDENFNILKQIDFLQDSFDSIENLTILELIQNSKFNEAIKQEGVDLIHFIKKVNGDKLLKVEDITISIFDTLDKNEILKNFRQFKLDNIKSLFKDKKVFLKDYNNCLKKLFELIDNPNKFFQDNNLKAKYELLKPIFENYSKKPGQNRISQYLTEENGTIILKEDKYGTFANRRMGKFSGGINNKKLLFIDEGQDCLTYEKLILFRMFNYTNIIVSSGEKEQLIRRSDICNWNKVNGIKLENFFEDRISSKTFRIKKNILDFCIEFSKKFKIDFKADSIESDDLGEVVISFNDTSSEYIIDRIKSGERNHCSIFESSLVLLESSTLQTKSFNESEITVNHLDNVIESKTKKKTDWANKIQIERNNFQFWDGINEKPKLPPYQNEIRLILYESCRGLEGWTTFCLGADKFFYRKEKSEDADKHLLNDIFVTEDERRKRYAATWMLLGFTRAINTLYIEIKDKNSELGQFILNYHKNKPNSIKFM